MRAVLFFLIAGLPLISPGAELSPRLEALFEKIDANDDDGLSVSELEESGHRTAWLARADRNGDAMVDRDELRRFFEGSLRNEDVSNRPPAEPAAERVVIENAVPEGAPVSRQGLHEACNYSVNRSGHSFLVQYRGETLYESYAGGWDAAMGHRLASGTKSFSAAILALAVKDELLTLDEPVSDTIREWKSDERLKEITVRQLLNLTSGIDPGPVGRVPSYAAAVGVSALSAAGEKFRYGPNAFQIFGELVRRKLAARDDLSFADPLDYLAERVFVPIGLHYTDWRRDEDGLPHLPSGAFLTARSWARFGQFLLQEGAWEGGALVDAGTLRESVAVQDAVAPAYGLTFWLLDGSADKQRPWLEGGYVAAGAGKQRLFVLPAVELVVVRQGESRKFENLDFLDALFSLDTGSDSAQVAP